jgi:hypothetical protein
VSTTKRGRILMAIGVVCGVLLLTGAGFLVALGFSGTSLNAVAWLGGPGGEPMPADTRSAHASTSVPRSPEPLLAQPTTAARPPRTSTARPGPPRPPRTRASATPTQRPPAVRMVPPRPAASPSATPSGAAAETPQLVPGRPPTGARQPKGCFVRKAGKNSGQARDPVAQEGGKGLVPGSGPADRKCAHSKVHPGR